MSLQYILVRYYVQLIVDVYCRIDDIIQQFYMLITLITNKLFANRRLRG